MFYLPFNYKIKYEYLKEIYLFGFGLWMKFALIMCSRKLKFSGTVTISLVGKYSSLIHTPTSSSSILTLSTLEAKTNTRISTMISTTASHHKSAHTAPSWVIAKIGWI